jgi:hypothetical protein
VKLGGNEVESESMNVKPIKVKTLSENGLITSLEDGLWLPKCLSTCGRCLYLPETKEGTDIQAKS